MTRERIAADAVLTGPRGVTRARSRWIRRGYRAVPAGTARALLPHARLDPRRGGPGPGDVPAGLAVLRRVRGTVLGPYLAVPDSHQPVPDRAGRAQPTDAAVRPV